MGMRSKVALTLVLGSLIPATPGMSAGRHVYRPEPSPPKDCTKLNGRNGYYGNPWCTEAEQRQWDRYDAAGGSYRSVPLEEIRNLAAS